MQLSGFLRRSVILCKHLLVLHSEIPGVFGWKPARIKDKVLSQVLSVPFLLDSLWNIVGGKRAFHTLDCMLCTASTRKSSEILQ